MSFCGVGAGSLGRGEKAAVAAVALAASASAWAAMFLLHAPGGGKGAHLHALAAPVSTAPIEASSFAALALMWTLMQAGMMLPPALPWILFFAAASREGPTGSLRPDRIAVFSSGYLAVWSGFGILAASAELALRGMGLLGGPGGSLGLKLAGGIVLVLAGAYQFTPLKNACLSHCRSPLTWFLAKWRDGPAGAFSMGARHGFYCLGCCWALMAVAFAVGVMNYLWMAVLTVALCIEKAAPGGERFSRGFGAALVLWGAFVIYLGFRG